MGYPQPKVLYLDKNVFKNVTSVFEFHIVPTQPYGTFDVDLDGQKILIVLSEKQKSLIQMWLRRTETSDIAVNAVFVPAVMQAVKLLRESDDNLDTRWAEIIRAKCEMKDIPLNSDSDSKTDLMIAQRLLDMPLNKLNTKFPLRG